MAVVRGSLHVESIDVGDGLFSPVIGDESTILTADEGVFGQFVAAMRRPLAATLSWSLDHLPMSVVLRTAGDFNQKGVVDAADDQVWRHTFGETAVLLPADGNGHGMVDAPDYNNWRNNRDNFGNAVGATVPEPSSLTFVMQIPHNRYNFTFPDDD